MTPELRLRILSAVVLTPLVVAAIWFGEVFFAVLVAVGVALMVIEWRGIVGASTVSPRAFAIALVAGASALLWEFGRADLALVAVALAAAASLMEGAGEEGEVSARLVAGGVLYCAVPGLAAIALRGSGMGGQAIAFVFAVVWATDIGAFFAGRGIGGPKLWPRVSPKKTWSGAVGGVLAAIVLGLAALWLADVAPRPIHALVAAVLSAVSQGGDLYESALKRRFDVKDSGRLIPGHGGILDRVDGLVAALVAAALIGWLAGQGRGLGAGLLFL